MVLREVVSRAMVTVLRSMVTMITTLKSWLWGNGYMWESTAHLPSYSANYIAHHDHLKAHGRNSYRHHLVDKCMELCAPSLGLLASSQVY